MYRDMAQRSFQERAQYQEGRKVRGSRQTHAMNKSIRFGRKEQEAGWKNAARRELNSANQPAAYRRNHHPPLSIWFSIRARSRRSSLCNSSSLGNVKR